MSDELTRQLETIFLLRAKNSDSVEVSSTLNIIFSLALNVSDAEIGYFSDTLFNESNGILKFLKQSVGSNELENAKADILRFLSEFCTKKIVKSYMKGIKETCMALYACDTSVKVKIEVMHVIGKIMLLPDIIMLTVDLDIKGLISKFWSECLKSARYSSTMRGELYNLMGSFAKMVPELITEINERLLSLFLSFLKQEMESTKKKKPELLVIAGCLNGLSGYLVHFTQSCAENSKYAGTIMKYVKMCILLTDYSRYDVPKAALTLLTLHSSQFNELLTLQAEQIYDALESWINHQNKEVKKIALTATESFLYEVSSYISSVKNDQTTKTLKIFLLRFHKTLNSQTANNKEITMAIKGYGKFSQAFRNVMTENEKRSVFDEILKRSEMILLNAELFHQLPTYLESLCCILKIFESVNYSQIHPIEKIIIFIFESVLNLGKTGLALYMKGIATFIDSMSSTQSMLKTSLSRIVYQFLIRTCSHTTLSEEVSTENLNKKEETITIKTFLPIWNFLFEEKNYSVSVYSCSDICEALKELVYDCVMSAFINVLNKLNFVTENKQEAEKLKDLVSDPTLNLVPRVPQDFVILVNLVDLFGELLCKKSLHSFSRWVYIFVKETLKFSLKFPFVSGFYKLLRHSSWILEQIEYFETNDQSDEKSRLFIMLSAFLKEVSARVKQFKEDLLVSAVMLLLSLPVSVIKESTKFIIPVFQVALQLGLSYYEIADLCLDTLDRLKVKLIESDMESIITMVLPYFNDYIQPVSIEEDMNTDHVTLTKSEKKVKRIPIRYLKALAMSQKESAESPLFKLELRIIKFLGCLGGRSSIGILQNTSKFSKLIVWDTVQHLPFALPFRDMKPTIYLDMFIPHVVQLALYSSNRQIKVVSSELLHGLVIFMLGKETQQQGKRTTQKISMERLYKEIFPALIKLSCSQEQVSEQLFSPLVFQIIHWFTGSLKYESPETLVLLDAILDGVSNPDDSAVRDFSAKCVKEFLSWSIKQTTEKQMESNPVNPKKLFKQMISLARHPNPYKRISAAIVFNNCYTVFREEEVLVNTFILELLIVYVNGLSLSHKDEKSFGSIDQYELSLQHMEKIVKKKCDLLLKPFKARRRPIQYKDTTDFNLRHVSMWLLSECGSPQTACRHQCMKLFTSLMLMQEGVEEYMKNAIADRGGEDLFGYFERGGISRKGIHHYPTLSERLDAEFSFSNTINWLENLLGALDCYSWIISAHYLTPRKIFKDNSSSKLFPTLVYFIDELSLLNCKSMLMKFKKEVLPSECDTYDRLKCTIIVRIIYVISLTLQDELWKADSMKDIGDKIFSDNFFKVIVYCMIHPQFLGFQTSDLEVLDKLPHEMYEFSEKMTRFASDHSLNFFHSVLSSVLDEKQYDLLSHLPVDICNTNNDMCDLLCQLALGYKLLHKCQLFTLMSSGKVVDLKKKLLESLMDSLSCKERVSFMLPAQKLLADNLLRLYLEINSSATIDLFFNESSSQKTESRGLVLYDLFRSVVINYYIEHPSSLQAIFDNSESLSFIHLIILQDTLAECISQKRKSIRSVQQFAFQLLKYPEKLCTGIRMEKTQIQILDIFLLILNVYEGTLNELPFLNALIQVLLDPTNSLAVKEKVISCSSQIFERGSSQQCADFKEALKYVVANDFPVNSDELQIRSLKYAEYTSCLSQFLRELVNSSSPSFFEVLVSVFVRELKSVYERIILPALQLFAKNLKVKDVEIVLDFCIKMFDDESKYADDIRAAIIDRVCIPLLNEISWINLKHFFQRNIINFTSRIDEKFNKLLQSKLMSQLINKICSFNILSLMYELLGKEELSSATSSIIRTFHPNSPNGKELTVFLSKAASQSYKESYSENNMELQRKYHCSAYNCLISIISCTQIEMKFFAGLLFAENALKGSFVLENLVDLKKEYNFKSNVSFEKKNVVKLIRKASCEVAHRPNQPENKGYIQSYNPSVYLTESSLSQEVMEFNINAQFKSYSNNEDKSFEEDSVSMETSLELDELNQHECMSKIISLINHMKMKNIYIQPNDEDIKEMPAWMIYFHGKINKDTELNVALYIARIVINEPKIFQPYAQFWFLPIIELILYQRIPGDYLNYFVVGLIETMLSWSPSIPENTATGSKLASGLLDYLVKNCHNLESPLLQTNLYLINTISSSWRDRVECPYKSIYSLFSFPDQSAKKNVQGLQIIGYFLANGFAPFSTQISGITEYDYFLALTNNLLFTYKEVYATCAEVCGISLKYYLSKCELTKTLLEMVQSNLCDLSKNNKEKFIVCLHNIQINYPMIVDRFISLLLYCTSNMFGTLKTMCIQCLASRTEQLPYEQQTIYSQIKGKEIDYILNTKDEETQIGGLKLIDSLLKGLSLDNLLSILKKIESLQKSVFVQVRESVYKIFMRIFDHFKGKKDIEEKRILISQICREVLLVGVTDTNTDLNLLLLNFWRKELSDNTIDRFIEILQVLYSSKTEKEYISYSTNLILQLTSLSPDYSLPLFSMGLDEEKGFSNFDVKFSWQHQRASLTPLFVSSQHSNTSGTYSKTQDNQDEVVRATQKKFEFSQTHQVDSSIDWMSPTVQITSQEILQGSNNQTNIKKKKKESEFKKPSSKDFRFRHFKNKSEGNYYFASLESKRQKLRESALEKRKIARDQKVVMYRKYRIGELPDIMIKHSDLIVPLQALAQLDHKVAHQLFISICSAILNHLSQSSELNSSKVNIQNALSLIMQSSVYYDPTFISAVETVSLKNKEVKLDPQVVSSASIISLQQPIGILLLEKELLILKDDIVEPKIKRARRESNHENIMIWSELAKIYTSIKDFDFVKSIVCSHISTNEVIKHALAAEATNDYSTALHIYRKASQNENWDVTPSYEEEEYWDTARLRCYENLAMWTNLNEFTVKSIEQINDSDKFDCMKMWENEILQEIYLPCYIRSNIKLMLEEKHDAVHKGFLKFIDSSLSDEYSKYQLQTRFCEDLALLKILQDNYGTAHHFLKIAELSFLNEWTLTSQFVNDDCVVKLNKLQRVEEMNSFVSLMTSDNYKDTIKVQEFITYWSNRLPDSKKHSTIAWNDIVLSRCAFIKKFKSIYLSDRVMLEFLEDEERKNILKLANVATKQGNFTVAKQYLRDSHDVITKELSAVGLQWRHLYAKIYCKTTKIFQNDVFGNFTALVSVIDHLEKCQLFDKTFATNLLEFDGWRCLSLCNSHLKNDEFKLITGEIRKLATFSHFEGGKQEFERTIKDKAWAALSLAYEKSIEYKISTEADSKLCHKAFMEMFSYCDELIENEENPETKCGYAKTMICSLLKAMTMSSSKARIAFPRLLQIVNQFPNTGELFEKQSCQVPCWMFLGWTNQIVSMMDKPIVVYLKSIIDNIAKSYKQALSYPLKVSSEQFNFNAVGPQDREYLKRLLRYVSIPVIDEFASALYQLSYPVSLVKDFLEQMKTYISNGSKDEIKKCYKSVNDLLLNSNSCPDSLPNGRVFIEFAKQFSSYVESLLGKDGENVLKMSLKEFQQATHQINQKLSDYKCNNASLSDYSPWLSSFQPDLFLDRLELPGQYTGESKPMVEYHVKINGFDEKVLVLNSLRKPKRITIRGDDEKDYYFLVKGGEDLRQDQRVQQVFLLMNKILQNDTVCCNRLLKLKTYQVIPITSRLGIIEWVNNTVPYFDFLCNDDAKIQVQKGPNQKYKQFQQKYGDLTNVYKCANRSETVKVFEDCVSIVPWDLLRRAFEKLALSSEAYFVLRRHFIQSHSCLCIAHYILGIGDRHLNNMLIDKKSGGVVGIDFGYAFGTATQLLRYPELVPFRLTQQMLNILLPLKDVSPYKQSMMAVLQALQQHSKMLISTMDIFINEPLIDWQNNAKKYESLKENSHDWYPKQKINICKQKLSGVNPAYITSEELRSSLLHQNDQFLLKSYIGVVEGSPQHNIRKKMLDRSINSEKEFLTVEEQVDCLVDQATDPNLLGRAYIGWCPWI